jgi:hypothetical protein
MDTSELVLIQLDHSPDLQGYKNSRNGVAKSTLQTTILVDILSDCVSAHHRGFLYAISLCEKPTYEYCHCTLIMGD